MVSKLFESGLFDIIVARSKLRCYSTFLSTSPTPPQGIGKPQFIRTKPHLNIGTIGHIDHGKTTLTAAITQVLSDRKLAVRKTYADIDSCLEERQRGITINPTYVEYSTEHRHYSHVDCPGHASYIKNMITGTSQMDAAILVIAGTEGTMPQTREHLMLARQIGVQNIVVYINKVDLCDEEILELAELEVEELLLDSGFDSCKVPIVKGSALCALQGRNPDIGADSILQLLNVMDTHIPVPPRDVDQPLMIPVHKTYSITGRGTVASGRIERGVVKRGLEVVVEGYGKSFSSVLTDIETFHKGMDHGEAGDQVGVLLRGVKREDIKRGMVIAKKGTVSSHNCVESHVYIAKQKCSQAITDLDRFMLYSKTWNIVGELKLLDKEMLMPEDDALVEMRTIKPVVMEVGQKFTMRAGELLIGAGVVTKLNKNITQIQADVINKNKRKRIEKATKRADTTYEWILPFVKINLHLPNNIEKCDYSPEEMRKISVEYMKIYSEYLHIYTDGSVNKEDKNWSAGCGIYVPQKKISRAIPLSSHLSCNEVELIAIKEALRLCYQFSDMKIAIFTDSRGACRNIINRNLFKNHIDEIHSHLKHLDKDLVIQWIPSHVDITGNEAADKIARAATTMNKTQ